jgi:hypothetical protein
MASGRHFQTGALDFEVATSRFEHAVHGLRWVRPWPAFPRVVVDDLHMERFFSSNAGLADNPAAREFHGKPLYGSVQVDDEGVKTGPTLLADKGISEDAAAYP